MNRTEWKPMEEIAFLLKGHQRLSVISCTVCASLSGTGGKAGIRMFSRICSPIGKTVRFARCVTPCCSQEVMEQTVKRYGRQINQTDALVLLSCASGVKAAHLAGVGIPVLSVLNPVGSVVIGTGERPEDPMLTSVCTICGDCVLSHTGGICPVHACPAGRKYGPCPKAPEGGGACAVKPDRSCVWADIASAGDLEALRDLKKLHAADDRTPVPAAGVPHTPGFIRKPVGRFLSIAQFIDRCIRWVQ